MVGADVLFKVGLVEDLHSVHFLNGLAVIVFESAYCPLNLAERTFSDSFINPEEAINDCVAL